MKRQKLLKKRVLALVLSTAVMFTPADTYAVLAAPAGNQETVEYDESQPVLTEEPEAEESGTGETESGLTDGQAPLEGSDSSEVTDLGTPDSDEAENTDSENNAVESPDDAEQTGEEETAEKPEDAGEEETPTEASEEESAEDEPEDNTAEVNEDESEESGTGYGDGSSGENGTGETAEIIDSGKINDISWSIDENGLLTIKGSGDYINPDDENIYGYPPPWVGRGIKSAKVDVSGITCTNKMFMNCTNLTNIEFLNFDTSNVTNMKEMFRGCSRVTSLDLSAFNTDNVTDMSSMFFGCHSMASLDVSSFNTDNVTDMSGMFYACSSITSLDLSGFNTDNVTDMSCMFYGCGSITSLDLSGFNTDNVTYMYSMFYGCGSITSLDLSSFNTSNVTSMSGMFYGCGSITSLDLSGFNTDNVTSMSHMFCDCSSITSLDLSGFNTGNVMNMSSMFSRCSSIASLDLSGFDTDNVTDMSGMFYACSSITSLDVSSFNTYNVTNMSNMFSGCNAITSLDVSGFNTDNATDMSNMFSGCNAITSLDVSGFNTSNVTNMKGMFSGCSSVTSFDVSSFNTYNVTNMGSMFSGCSSVTSFGLSAFNTDNVTDMRSMFFGCNNMTSLDLSSFNTDNTTNMSSMFSRCNSVTSLDISSFNTDSVIDMSEMFSGCKSVTSLDISSFNTGNVTNMSKMFSGCNSITGLNVKAFNTVNVTNMSRMFDGCSSLTSLDLSNFDTGNVTGMSYMFNSCQSLTSLDLSSFDAGNVTGMDGMFWDCSSLVILKLSENDVCNVTSMNYMFTNCNKLESLDLSSFDMAKTVSMRSMLTDCGSLTHIRAPRNCKGNVQLPAGSSDKWYMEEGVSCVTLPKDLAESIDLYKNASFMDGKLKYGWVVAKIDDIDRVYTGKPALSVEGLEVRDTEGNKITDDIISYSYAGTLADGSTYEESPDAPSQVGQYTLTVIVAENDKYITGKETRNFEIKPKELIIRGPILSIYRNDDIPDLSTEKALVYGMAEGDSFITQPQLKYNTDEIPNDVRGSYDIIPYGADAGSNYNIRYEKGMLHVMATAIQYKGTSGTLTWKIVNMTLTIKGTGDYAEREWCNYECARRIERAIIDVSGITTMKNMFSGCYWLKSVDFTNSDTSNVTDMSGMFGWCERLKSIDLGSFNTDNVTDMSRMFRGCRALEELDMSNFNTSSVIDMNNMFCACVNLKNLNISSFDTSNVTNMEDMFYLCGSLTGVDVSSFDTGNVTNMGNMFNGCGSLTEVDVSGFNTGNVQSMENMFRDCSSLVRVDVSGFNTENVQSMKWMFYKCNSLTGLDVSGFNTGNVQSMVRMFSDCDNLPYLDVSKFNTSNVTNMAYTFARCSGLTSLDVSNFNTKNVEDMEGMFSDCSSLTNLELGDFNTNNATNISSMFRNCSSLKNLNLSSFDTRNVEQMQFMFDCCSSLTDLDLSNFDTSEVVEMAGMFADCSSLSSLDLNNFDTSKVVDEGITYMFDGCSNLSSLDLSNFDVSKVYSVAYMFSGCSSLRSLDLSTFDLSNVSYDASAFKDCDSLFYIRAPKNCKVKIPLPTGPSGTDIWYQALDTPCTILPQNQSTSLELYRNGYPGDGVIKMAAIISDIDMDSRVYNGHAAQYIGTPTVKDLEGNKITDVTFTYAYSGTLADGSVYAETQDAPSQTGDYKLFIKAESKDCSGQAVCSFCIEPRTVLVSAKSLSIEVGEELPKPADLSYTVTGFIGDDTFTTTPVLKYSESDIQTDTVCRYGIIPYGAAAGYNYRIEYKEGTLTVGDPDDDSSFDMDERTYLNSGLSSLSCTIAPIRARVYNGTAYEPTIRVTVTENTNNGKAGKKKVLTEGTDYRVLYENNVDVGTGTVTVRGSGIYKGFAKAEFKITPKPVKKLKVAVGSVTGSVSEAGINSGEISLPVCVYDAGKLLKKDQDYTIAYDTLKKGTLTVKIKAVDGSNYMGETKAKITVYEGVSEDHVINPGNVALKSYTEQYTGKAIKPAVEVRINGTVIPSKNYKVQYQNNKNAGTAYVIVTGKGAYKGKVVTEFEITANTQDFKITNNIKAQTYKGKYIKPSVTVKAGNKKLKKNTDYIVTYKNNFHAGTATITVTGKGNYTGSAVKTFVINPLKAAKISVKGTWKDSNGDGVMDSGALTVTQGKRQLKEGRDYELVPDNSSIKKNKIKVTLKGAENSDFTGSVVKTLKME